MTYHSYLRYGLGKPDAKYQIKVSESRTSSDAKTVL